LGTLKRYLKLSNAADIEALRYQTKGRVQALQAHQETKTKRNRRTRQRI
jgi:hypothetical protein